MGMVDRFPKYRILISRLFMVALLALLLGTRHELFADPLVARIAAELGLALLVICALGRLWSLQYLAGYKTRKVVREGPYSMSRNPLYIFSFLGAMGLLLTANHLWFAVIMLLTYVFYYPWVVISEERGLIKALGEPYKQYCREVPRFLPRFSAYNEPDQYEISARKFSKNYAEVIWFPLAWILLRLLIELRDAEVFFSPFSL